VTREPSFLDIPSPPTWSKPMSRILADASLAMAPARAVSGPAPAGVVLRHLARRASMAALAWLLLWQDRANQRHRLSMAEDDMLRDIGLTRAEVAREVRKPFWRP
jgi:uncharacterized protein YjiS (DUF1127 family)